MTDVKLYATNWTKCMYYHNLFKIMQFYRIKEMEWAKHAMFHWVTEQKY